MIGRRYKAYFKICEQDCQINRMHKNKNKAARSAGNAYDSSINYKYAILFSDRIIEIHNEI